jgi:hypothetical protein
MTKMKLSAIAAATWVGGFLATAALAYTLNRPLKPMANVSSNVAAGLLEDIDIPAPEPEHVIVLPTVEIVGKAPTIARTIAPPRALHCSDWRPLQQGGNSVQICD